jgi:hypothetical protein
MIADVSRRVRAVGLIVPAGLWRTADRQSHSTLPRRAIPSGSDWPPKRISLNHSYGRHRPILACWN